MLTYYEADSTIGSTFGTAFEARSTYSYEVVHSLIALQDESLNPIEFDTDYRETFQTTGYTRVCSTMTEQSASVTQSLTRGDGFSMSGTASYTSRTVRGTTSSSMQNGTVWMSGITTAAVAALTYNSTSAEVTVTGVSGDVSSSFTRTRESFVSTSNSTLFPTTTTVASTETVVTSSVGPITYTTVGYLTTTRADSVPLKKILEAEAREEGWIFTATGFAVAYAPDLASTFSKMTVATTTSTSACPNVGLVLDTLTHTVTYVTESIGTITTLTYLTAVNSTQTPPGVFPGTVSAVDVVTLVRTTTSTVDFRTTATSSSTEYAPPVSWSRGTFTERYWGVDTGAVAVVVNGTSPTITAAATVHLTYETTRSRTESYRMPAGSASSESSSAGAVTSASWSTSTGSESTTTTASIDTTESTSSINFTQGTSTSDECTHAAGTETEVITEAIGNVTNSGERSTIHRFFTYTDDVTTTQTYSSLFNQGTVSSFTDGCGVPGPVTVEIASDESVVGDSSFRTFELLIHDSPNPHTYLTVTEQWDRATATTTTSSEYYRHQITEDFTYWVSTTTAAVLTSETTTYSTSESVFVSTATCFLRSTSLTRAYDLSLTYFSGYGDGTADLASPGPGSPTRPHVTALIAPIAPGFRHPLALELSESTFLDLSAFNLASFYYPFVADAERYGSTYSFAEGAGISSTYRSSNYAPMLYTSTTTYSTSNSFYSAVYGTSNSVLSFTSHYVTASSVSGWTTGTLQFEAYASRAVDRSEWRPVQERTAITSVIGDGSVQTANDPTAIYDGGAFSLVGGRPARSQNSVQVLVAPGLLNVTEQLDGTTTVTRSTWATAVSANTRVTYGVALPEHTEAGFIAQPASFWIGIDAFSNVVRVGFNLNGWQSETRPTFTLSKYPDPG